MPHLLSMAKAATAKFKSLPLRSTDLRGATQLAVQGCTALSHVVEGVHSTVHRQLGLSRRAPAGHTDGLTAWVYRTIRGVTRGVGQGLDIALQALEPLLQDQDAQASSPEREAWLAALNGVLGDHLAAQHNPLATPMTLRLAQGQLLDVKSLEGQVLPGSATPAGGAASTPLKPRILLMLHGLCMNDLQWRTEREGTVINHGQALAQALDATPLYLRYNSGLHVSQNGRELAHQLETVLAQWPVPLEGLQVLAHSMGGLVMRSALHIAQAEGMRWPAQLKTLVFLGTPHHGAPLERAGHGIDILLGSSPYAAPLAKLGQLRSAGITDLRHGLLFDEDWQGLDRFRRHSNKRRALPLPEGVNCLAIAASLAARRAPLADRLIGDGLVPLDSALGHHADPRFDLQLPPAAQWTVYRTGHLQLLSSLVVQAKLKDWLTGRS